MERTAVFLINRNGSPAGVYVADSREEVVRYASDWPGKAIIFDARELPRTIKETDD